MRQRAESTPLERFTQRQTDLNKFLWTTELVYGIVKQSKMLEKLPQDEPAWEVLGHIRSEAWFPTTRSLREGTPGVKYRGTIRQMRGQIDRNMVVALWTVAAMFVAEYETYVETRFAGWFAKAAEKRARERGKFMLPSPAALLESLRKHFGGGAGKPIAAEVVLKADLMKRLRNLYVHKGLAGIPRRIDHPEIESWIAQFEKAWLPYSTQQARDVVAKVIGKAVDKGEAVGAANRPLGPEFFYALFTLTNIRRFVLALDGAFPTDPRPASAATAS